LGHKPLYRLAEKLAAGEIVLPDIQRDYVWRGMQIPRLLDSLNREWPVGSILLWDTNLEIPTKPIAVRQGTPGCRQAVDPARWAAAALDAGARDGCPTSCRRARRSQTFASTPRRASSRPRTRLHALDTRQGDYYRHPLDPRTPRRRGSCAAPSVALRREHARRCTRTLALGADEPIAQSPGEDSVQFDGRIGRHEAALHPGAYTAILTASNTSGRSQPVTLPFTIVP
jgi:hypothetical protein